VQRHQRHGDGRAIGFAVDVPVLDAEPLPDLVNILSCRPGSEIGKVDAPPHRLVVARHVGGPQPGLGVLRPVRKEGDRFVQKPAVEIAAQVRLGSADAALIDQNRIALRGIRFLSLIRRINGQGLARAAVNVDDGSRKAGCCALLAITTESANVPDSGWA